MELFNLTTPQKNISDAEIGQNFHNNVGGRVVFKSITNIQRLKKSLVEIVNLEDCFKIRVVNKNGQLLQYFDKSFLFKESDIKNVNFDNLSCYYTWEKCQFSQHVFRENSPLFKLYLCKVGKSVILFFLTSHFITDGYSLVINLLNKLLTDNKVPLNSYKEYIKDEEFYLKSKRYEIDQEYWSNSMYNKKIFSFLDEYETIKNFNAGSVVYDINHELSDQIVEYCKSKNITVLEFWLLVLTLFLGEDEYVRDNQKTFISIGTPFMNRYTKKQRNTSGMFVNVLPFIIKPDLNLSIKKYLKNIREKSFELIKHGRVSNLEIQKKYMRLNNENTNLLGIMLNYIQTKKTQESDYGKYQMYWPENEHNINPLTVNVVNFDKTNNFNLKMDFQRAYFSPKSMKLLFDGLAEIISLLINNKIKTIGDIPCERYQLFREEVSNYIKSLTDKAQNLTKEEDILFQNRNANEWNCSICKLSNKINEQTILFQINRVFDKYPQINNTFNLLKNKVYKNPSSYHNFYYDKLTFNETIDQINKLDVNSEIDLGSEPLLRVISFERNNEQYLCIELHKLAGNINFLAEISQFLIGNDNTKIKYLSLNKSLESKNSTVLDTAFIPYTSINGQKGKVSYISENVLIDKRSFREETKKVYYSFVLTLSRFSDNKLVKVGLNNEIAVVTEIISHGNEMQFKDGIIRNDKTNYSFSAYEINVRSQLPLLFEIGENDISISFGFNGTNGLISFIYNPTFFTKDFINHFKSYFMNVYSLICKNKYSEINKLNPDRLLLKKNNQNNSDYEFEFIDKFLVLNAEKFPTKIAASDENRSITYKELNNISNKVADYLINNTRTRFIGVCMNRSINTIISFYGILKAGKTYVPIDPAYPQNRINYIINDAKIDKVIIDNTTNISFESKNVKTIDLTKIIINSDEKNSKSLYEIKRSSSDPAYIIYTSGTTGKPKGVVNIHRSMTNTTYSFIKLLGISSKDKFLFKTSFGFDMSLLEIIVPIVVGGSVFVAKNSGEQDPEYIEHILKKYKPTAVFFTPSLLRTYMDNIDNDSLNNLRLIYFAAEPLSSSTLVQLQKVFKGKIYNLYGPTETCILCTGKEYKERFKEDSVVRIGRPFPNVNIHILNKEGMEQPIGCIGEICISGYNLAQGYLNKKELTNKAFKQEKTVDGIKLVYHSGDIGRVFSDGEVECFGRTDDQVKVRGNRVELGEVNRNIMQYPGITNAYSIIKKDAYENNYIASAFVSSEEIDPEKIRMQLRGFLPKSYMPTILVQVKKIPSNFNGKVDKNKLAEKIEHEINKNGKDGKGKKISAKEAKFYEIIKAILNLKYVDPQQDFFEIGGNSLAVTYLVNKIQEAYRIELSLQDVYIHSKLQDLLAFIEQKVKSKATKVMPINVVLNDFGKFKMSSNQRRMYLIQKSAPESTAYNVARYLKIPKKYPMDNLKNILDQISLEQATFRTTFQLENNNFYQIVHKHSRFNLVISKSNKDYSENELSTLLSEYVKPFDLDNGPLFRVKLIAGNDYNYLLFDMHHIIVDGESMRILLNELLSGILNKKIKKPEIQYVDFSQWFDKQDLQPEVDYWSSRHVDCSQAEILPNRISLKGINNAGYIQKALDVKNVDEVAKKLKISVYSLFLSVYFITLYRYIDQGEITIASPVSGRIRYETNDLIGMFVNTILINDNVDLDETIINFMKKINYIANDSINNQSLPYEDIIRYFSNKVKYDLTKSISFFYSLSDDFKIYNDLNKIGAKFGKSSIRQAQFPISLEIIKRPNGYFEELTYAKNIFDDSFASKIIKDINYLSLYATSHPLNTIGDALGELNSLDYK